MRNLVVWGVGELGTWLGGAALRAGLRVTPITRAQKPDEVWAGVPPRTPVLVAVGEDALDGVLRAVPSARALDVVLLQNELFPEAWQQRGVTPTVLVPWFLKKRGQPELVGRPTRVFGAQAKLFGELHDALGVPWLELTDEQALHQALVEKYAFILTINALGLLKDRTLGVWVSEDPMRVEALAREATRLGALRCGASVDEQASVEATFEGMHALKTIAARGRTASERVRRALSHARERGLAMPELERVAREATPSSSV